MDIKELIIKNNWIVIGNVSTKENMLIKLYKQ